MTIDEELLEQFQRDGYVVFEGFLSPVVIESVRDAVDRFAAAEKPFDGRHVPGYPELVDLATDRRVLELVESVMGGTEFTVHHCHAARHDAGLGGVNWHHDYEQVPQTNRAHMQVHILAYLNGLNGTIGDLLVWPGSHRAVMRRDACAFVGTELLPGSVVIDDLQPGSVMLVHSALVHARRPRPGGENNPRYFIDISYCDRAVRWPSYGRDGWEEMLRAFAAAAAATPDGRAALDRYPHLFDESTFFDIADAVARIKGLDGSLAVLLPETANSERPQAGSIPVVG